MWLVVSGTNCESVLEQESLSCHRHQPTNQPKCGTAPGAGHSVEVYTALLLQTADISAVEISVHCSVDGAGNGCTALLPVQFGVVHF